MGSGLMKIFGIGDIVRTSETLGRRDYNDDVIRRRNAIGMVIAEHNSHGLCFDVKHDDGTIGCYDPDELKENK
jgi:hypothetical protein